MVGERYLYVIRNLVADALHQLAERVAGKLAGDEGLDEEESDPGITPPPQVSEAGRRMVARPSDPGITFTPDPEPLKGSRADRVRRARLPGTD